MGHAKKIYIYPPIYPLMYTLLRNFPVSPGRNFFLYLPIPPFIPSRGSRGCKSAYSPLPYNRLINQYNIFTERDSSERYCRYRETLSKARRTGRRRRRRRGSQSSTIVPSLFPNPPSLLFSSTRFLSFANAYTRGGNEI